MRQGNQSFAKQQAPPINGICGLQITFNEGVSAFKVFYWNDNLPLLHAVDLYIIYTATTGVFSS